MARLIVLNGMPAVGKTTLARRYAADHPMTLVLELDLLRRLLGGWDADPTRAGLLARAMSVQMAQTHLRHDLDVIVPQFLARPEFLEQLSHTAQQAGAGFVEIVLSDDRDELLRRFTARTAAAAEPAHVDAQRLVDRAGGSPALTAMYDRLLQLISTRPHIHVLSNADGHGDRTYQQILELVSSAAPPGVDRAVLGNPAAEQADSIS